jgi:hypothetical protein
VKVVGASLENGLLSIDLAREVPEAMKPAPHLDQRQRQRDDDRPAGSVSQSG